MSFDSVWGCKKYLRKPNFSKITFLLPPEISGGINFENSIWGENNICCHQKFLMATKIKFLKNLDQELSHEHFDRSVSLKLANLIPFEYELIWTNLAPEQILSIYGKEFRPKIILHQIALKWSYGHNIFVGGRWGSKVSIGRLLVSYNNLAMPGLEYSSKNVD